MARIGAFHTVDAKCSNGRNRKIIDLGHINTAFLYMNPDFQYRHHTIIMHEIEHNCERLRSLMLHKGVKQYSFFSIFPIYADKFRRNYQNLDKEYGRFAKFIVSLACNTLRARRTSARNMVAWGGREDRSESILPLKGAVCPKRRGYYRETNFHGSINSCGFNIGGLSGLHDQLVILVSLTIQERRRDSVGALAKLTMAGDFECFKVWFWR